MKKNLLALSVLSIFLLSSCSVIFMPRKQKVTFITPSKESEVYLDNVSIGKGKVITEKIKKSGMKQVVVVTPGYKNEHKVLVPQKRNGLFYPMVVLDAISFYGIYAAQILPNNGSFQYDKKNNFKNQIKKTEKEDNQKEINIKAIGIDIKDTKKNIKSYRVRYGLNLNSKFKEAILKQKVKDEKIEKKLAKKNKNRKLLDESKETLEYDNSIFVVDVFKSLKETGFVDTTGKILSSAYNELGLEGKIRDVKIFYVYPKHNFSSYKGSFYQSQMSIDWYLLNSYGEKMDSINTKEFSGEFLIPNYSKEKETLKKTFSDNVNISFNKLFTNKTFTKHLEKQGAEDLVNTAQESLNINRPRNTVTDLKSAVSATVTIVIDDFKGHGSGFAVSNDGYVITNYHVIATEVKDKYQKFKVMLSNGDKVDAKVVRVDKLNDLALLKIESNFDHAFELNNTKQFEKFDDIYAIGAPKSLDLEQTVTRGLISNERQEELVKTLQLSISVNSGNSGGPVVSKDGKLHGVIRSKLVGKNTEGIGFAIPAYEIMKYLNIKY